MCNYIPALTDLNNLALSRYRSRESSWNRIVAPSASAAVCGFEGKATGSPLVGKGDDGKYEEGVYTNCNDHPVKIKVKYHYASEDRCVGPGENQLTVNPNLGALVGAEEIGKC